MTVDPELVHAGRQAVEEGIAPSFSAWVSEALQEKVRRDRKLALLAAAVEDFEREYGEITTDEVEARRRTDRIEGRVVRGPRRGRAGSSGS